MTDPYTHVEHSCSVFDLLAPSPVQNQPFGDFDVTYLDAGPSVAIESPGSAFANLDRDEQDVDYQTIIFYSLDSSISGTLPTGLTATVPGTSEFPTFNDEDFQAVGTSFSLDSSIDVGVDSEFAWAPSASANTIVTIPVASTTTDFDFTTISCIAEDDGSFEFPEDTKQELGSGFSGQAISAGRQAFRIDRSGDAALFLGSS